VEWVHIRAFIN